MVKKPAHRLPPLESWPDWSFFLIFFCYSLIVGLLVQLVLLPYVFPSWHAGEGLLVGLDSRGFHRLALEITDGIKSEGWQAWTITGQPVSGIAAIFYVLIAPHPWAVLPLNAFLHALAGWILYKTMAFFLEKRTYALLAALPLFLFPSALSWVTQMHNENYSVAGGVLLLYAWVCFTRKKSWENYRVILGGMASLVLGVGLSWLVRDYVVSMYTAVGGILFVFAVIVFLVRLFRSHWKWKKTLVAIGTVSLAFFLTASLQIFNLSGGMLVIDQNYQQELTGIENTPEPTEEVGTGQGTEPQATPVVEATPEPGSDLPMTQPPVDIGVRPSRIWTKSSWLPGWIDYQMEQLSIKRAKALRRVWTDTRGGSNIDTDVLFYNALDMVQYVPRALEIGFLHPFPADWFGQGSKAPNTMMRRVSGLEMTFAYLSWIGLLVAAWTWRKRPEFWVGLLFCAGIVIIYAFGTPNVGTLYRLRYPFFMSMVGLGTAGLITAVQAVISRRKNMNVGRSSKSG